MNENRSDRNKKRSRVKITIISIIVLMLVGVFWFLHSVYKSVDNNMSQSYSQIKETNGRDTSKLVKEGKPISILLLGTDTGALKRTDKGRTDTMMLITISKKSVKLTSIPRDTIVTIPGMEKETDLQKINSVYTFTNVSKTVSTVSKYLNVPIDYYALVNMGGLEKIVNQLGGIKVKSPLTFTFSPDTAHSYGKNLYKFYKGKTTFKYAKDGVHFKTYHKMNGAAALAFTRMRYEDPRSDYGRTQRQRLVIEQILKHTKDPRMLLNQKFMKSISSNVRTNISTKVMLSIATEYFSARKHVKATSIAESNFDYNGVDYEVLSNHEKQKVTNNLRSELELKHAKTGPILAGDSKKIVVPDELEELLYTSASPTN